MTLVIPLKRIYVKKKIVLKNICNKFLLELI